MQQRAQANYEAEGGVGEFPWALFADIVKNVLEVCKAKDIVELSKKHPVFVQRKMLNKAMDEGYNRKEAKVLAASALKTLQTTSPTVLAAAILT